MRTIRQTSGRPSPPSAHRLHFSFSQQQQSNSLDITLDPSRGTSQVLRDSNAKDSTQDYLEDSSLRVVPLADDRPGTPASFPHRVSWRTFYSSLASMIRSLVPGLRDQVISIIGF